MPHPSQPCLFDQWRAESAPGFHMSEFWPAFAESDIEAFINSGIARPKATKALNVEAATRVRDVISRFVAKLEGLAPGEYACRQAYLDFETDRLAALDMVLADGDQSVISRANDRQFGKLDDIYYSEALSHLADHIRRLKPRSTAVEAARSRLMAAWKDITPAPRLTAEFNAIEQARLSLRPVIAERFGFVVELLKPSPDHRNIPSPELGDIMNASLAHILGPKQADWRATVKVAAPNVFIDNDGHQIIIPAGREYTKDHAGALIVHEIGVHVERAVNGALSRERLAGFGLSGYGAPEEAFGVLVGSATAPAYNITNGLAAFAVIEYAGRAHVPEFREVFDFTADLVVCLANPDEATSEAKSHRFRRAAFSKVWRTLRLGRPGLIERSTTKYWRGLTLITKHLQTVAVTPAGIDELLLGKYDPLNPDHLKLIKEHV